MRGKPVTSGERAIIFNVFKHLKGNFPLETGALNEELLEMSYNKLEIYQD